MSLEWHPHYDVWALIISLIIFFEYTTNNNDLKKPKRKFWYSGLIILWIFTDWPLHDIGEKYLFSVHSVEHLVLALVSPPLLLIGLHSAQKKLISIKPFISILKITSNEIFIPITASGGIRSISDAKNLIMAGADKIAVNTAGLRNPKLLKDLVESNNIQNYFDDIFSVEAVGIYKPDSRVYEMPIKKYSCKSITGTICSSSKHIR